MRIGIRATVLVVALLTASVAGAAALPAKRVLTHEILALSLGPTPGTDETVFAQALAVSREGVVVGASTGPNHGSTHAFVFARGELSDLGTLGGDTSIAYDVDDSGVVIGAARTAEEALVAVEWRDGHARPLGTLGGRESAAAAIGDDGTIVGWSQTTDGALHAFVRRPDSPMQDLGTLGGTTSIASAIDGQGTIVGASSRTGDGPLQAAVWRDGEASALEPLPGTVSGSANDVDRDGTVVGAVSLADGRSVAVVWENGVAPRALATPDGSSSVARGLNDRGWIVGEIVSGDGVRTPVLWVDGLRIELRTLLPRTEWTLEEAADVNDRGFIVGTGRYRGTSAFLIRPLRQDVEDLPD
jgi:probable HAF family extracellular repeat protein